MRGRLAAFFLVSLVLGLAPFAGAAQAAGVAWSYDRLMRRIDGVRVQVGTARYRLDRTMVVCNGVGRVRVSGGVRRWPRFACTQSVFRSGMLVDISFGVLPLDRHRCWLIRVRYGP